MIRFHLGSTEVPCELRSSHEPKILSNKGNYKRYVTNPIKKMYGISFRDKWFFGYIKFDPQR